jgi:hypothetical protein
MEEHRPRKLLDQVRACPEFILSLRRTSRRNTIRLSFEKMLYDNAQLLGAGRRTSTSTPGRLRRIALPCGGHMSTK